MVRSIFSPLSCLFTEAINLDGHPAVLWIYRSKKKKKKKEKERRKKKRGKSKGRKKEGEKIGDGLTGSVLPRTGWPCVSVA